MENAVSRRRVDGLQVAAGVCIALLLAGEVVLLVFVFNQHRSRQMPVADSKEVAAAATPAPVAPTNLPARLATPSEALPVLNPAVKIQRAQRADTPGAVTLEVRLRAQTGERQFDARAATVSVEWRRADGSKRLEWLATPVEWENFAVKTVQARHDAPPSALRGCVVRTYYRQQLQDEQTVDSPNP